MTRNAALGILGNRTERIDQNWSYKLADSDRFGMDVAFADRVDLDENAMSVWIPFADGNRRDGVGDLLEVTGINTERHRSNPIVLFDHGKQVTLPVALAEDRATKAYTVQIDSISRSARANAFFYQGKGIRGVEGEKEYDHALFCEQLFDLIRNGYVRAGSIGYQVINAREMPPDYEKGTPKGLHLLAVKMLEISAVVLPANGDTVRKALCLQSVCGKPLSHLLVKSLTPYASGNKVQLGYEKKTLPEIRSQYRIKSAPPQTHAPKVQQEKAGFVRRNLGRAAQVAGLAGVGAAGYLATRAVVNRLGGSKKPEMPTETYALAPEKSLKSIRLAYRGDKDLKKVGSTVGGVFGGAAGLALGGSTMSGVASAASTGIALGSRLGSHIGEKVDSVLSRVRKKRPGQKSQIVGDLDWLKEEQEEIDHSEPTLKSVRAKYRNKRIGG